MSAQHSQISSHHPKSLPTFSASASQGFEQANSNISSRRSEASLPHLASITTKQLKIRGEQCEISIEKIDSHHSVAFISFPKPTAGEARGGEASAGYSPPSPPLPSPPQSPISSQKTAGKSDIMSMATMYESDRQTKSNAYLPTSSHPHLRHHTHLLLQGSLSPGEKTKVSR